MTDNWPKVDELYHAALECAPADRQAFLAEACSGDDELRREVLSLLAHEAEAERLMEQRAVSAATQKLAVVRGTRLGPYEVVDLIGAGGMGEVYRARDTRLGRDVAIKVLPEQVAHDPEALRRFDREARAVAALSHPNILALFDVGRQEATPYVVEELLEGETLRDRLQTGALPVRTAVDYALQMARGLAAAHEKGIVHRDLKPQNLFVTKDGVLKILDFGLARQGAVAVKEDTDSPTLTRETIPGAVLGTVGYMSPEQVRGLPADQRSDLFAFGCVLYELLSGRRAFSGATAADTMSAILNKDPTPLAGSAGTIPAALQAIVNRCLEKRAEDRFQSARDLASALQAEAEALLRTADAETAVWFPWRQRPALRDLVRSRRVLLAVLLGIVLVSVVGWRLHQRRAKGTWARSEAIPEIMRLADGLEYWPAFLLARQVEAILPGDPVLARIWPRITYAFPRQVRPADAEVFARSPSGAEGDWIRLGQIDSKSRTPKGYTLFKMERPGFDTLVVAMAADTSELGRVAGFSMPITLRAKGDLPPRMVRIELPPLSTEQQGTPFLMDMYEVTNREFRDFVDAGGYRRRDLWRHEFQRNGKPLSWEEAMALFRDPTGRPGPATWELGTYHEGRAEYPVTGVSWYEATAYADFVGKRLPAVPHWDAAASYAVPAAYLIPGSNFSGGLAPVGSYRGGVNYCGLYDMAGNAREWCSNAVGEKRMTRGGACNDAAYLFVLGEARSPLDRNPTTGFRCMKAMTGTSTSEETEAPLPPPVDWGKVRPFPETVWEVWKALLSYPELSLEAKTELVDETPLQWRMEKVSFAAAYGGERMPAYLFLPRSVRPPYQALVYWPGSAACMTLSSDNGRNLADAWAWDYFVRDGRAVICPILKDTYERGNGKVPDETRDTIVTWAKDISRSVDYLESRSDIDESRIAYLGFSWGAQMGSVPCAVDKRLKTCLFRSGGIQQSDGLGWARRVRTPVLMINGRYDAAYPYQESQLPMFRALATPDAHKSLVLLDADHSLVGREHEVMKATLQWLDKYLGPAK